MKNKKNINLILSYPRSGANWLRYIIEYNTSYSTTGITQDTPNRKPLHNKFNEINSKNKSENDLFYHDHSYVNYGGDKLIYIIRDYKESVVRHILEGDISCSTKKFDNIKNSLIVMYMHTLSIFHNYTGPKLLVRYEDIIDTSKLPNVVDEICKFLDVPIKDIVNRKTFLRTLPTHIENSRNFYKNVGVRKGYSDAKSAKWHSNKLTEKQINELDSIAKTYPILYTEYLEIYKTNK